MPEEKVKSVDLTDDERRMLASGVSDWGGPAHPTEALAVALGFADIEDLVSEGERIAEDIVAGRPLPVRDWTRAMVATEVAFASKLLGTGGSWTSIQGGDDRDWVCVLRRLQQKVPQARRFLDGRAGPTRRLTDGG